MCFSIVVESLEETRTMGDWDGWHNYVYGDLETNHEVPHKFPLIPNFPQYEIRQWSDYQKTKHRFQFLALFTRSINIVSHN